MARRGYNNNVSEYKSICMYQIQLYLVYSTLHETDPMQLAGNEISNSMKYFYTFKMNLQGWLKTSTAFQKWFLRALIIPATS